MCVSLGWEDKRRRDETPSAGGGLSVKDAVSPSLNSFTLILRERERERKRERLDPFYVKTGGRGR